MKFSREARRQRREERDKEWHGRHDPQDFAGISGPYYIAPDSGPSPFPHDFWQMLTPEQEIEASAIRNRMRGVPLGEEEIRLYAALGDSGLELATCLDTMWRGTSERVIEAQRQIGLLATS